MNFAEILNGPVGMTLGWTLIHLLWQATAVALILGAIRVLWVKASSSARYLTALAGLIVVLMLPALTFSHLWTERAFQEGTIQTGSAGTLISGVAIEYESGLAAIEQAVPLTSGVETMVSNSLPWLVGMWMFGVALLATRLTLRAAWTTRLTRDRITEVEGSWHRAVARLRKKLDLRRAIAIYESALVEVPTVVGWFKPVILVPTSVFTGLTYRQIETILAHELAHVRRHDALINFFQSIVETLFFYHPAVWWISGRIRIEREHCCDDVAVSLCRDRVAYAKALTFLEEMRATAPEGALAATGGSLLERIRRIAGAEERDRKAPSIAALVLLMTLGGATVWALSTPEPETDSKVIVEEDDSGWWYVPPPAPTVPPSPPAPISALPSPPPAPSAPPAPPESYESWIVEMAEQFASAGWIDDLVPPPEPPPAPMPPTPRFDHGLDMPAPPAPPSVPRIAAVAPVANLNYTVRAADLDEPDRRIGETLSIDDLIRLRSVGVTTEYLQSLQKMGYTDLTIGELVAMRSVGITPNYIDAMKGLFGRELTTKDLIRLRGVGVSVDWADSMKEYSDVRLTPEDAIRIRGVGVSPEWIGTMTRVLGESLTLDDAVRLRGVGVSQVYIDELERSGIGVPPIEDLIRLRGVGVTAEYIDEMRKAGLVKISVDELVRLRGVGVTPSYIAEMKAAGFPALDLDTLVRLRGVGVNPAYLKSMREAGISVSSAEDLVRLRGMGVTPEYVRALREAGLENLSIDKLIRLRSAGVDAKFIRDMKKAR